MMKALRLTLPEVVVIGLVVIVGVGLILSMVLYQFDHRLSHKHNCANNLKQIGLSLLMYSGDFDGYFPNANPNWPPHGNFEPLAEVNYIQEGNVWSCPQRATALTLARNASYRYIGSGLNDDNALAPSVSLAYDESGNHPDNAWMNVLFIDGHVHGASPGSTPWAQND